MFFNSDTDLPDNLLSLKTNSSVHIINAGTEYDVTITIRAGDTAKYKVIIDSIIHTTEKEFNLKAGENKKFAIKIKPTSTDKWTINSTEKYEWNDEIDITQDSWLAEKRDFAILMDNNTLPTIVMEDYHLPISNQITNLGNVYHVNLDLNELIYEPFTKSYETIIEQQLFKQITTDEVVLKVKNEVIYLNSKQTIKSYNSQVQGFSIKLYNEDILQADKKGFRKAISDLSFLYQII